MTKCTSGLLMPIPKAMVATMTWVQQTQTQDESGGCTCGHTRQADAISSRCDYWAATSIQQQTRSPSASSTHLQLVAAPGLLDTCPLLMAQLCVVVPACTHHMP
jgi:hypothetical protein